MELLSRFRNKENFSTASSGTELCCLCREPLSGRVIHDAWGNSAHLTHSISFCGSCDRILSPDTSGGGYRYGDGRNICGICKKTAVADGVTANRCRRKILGQLETLGFAGIPKNIEVVLAHPQTLAAHSRKRNTAGLTLSHLHFADYKRVNITHQIGILFGLPQVEFEGVVAHELLHVWQHENDVKFSPMYSEGLCELASYHVYSQDGSDLARHFLDKMMQRKDPVYGNGFRLMQKKLEGLGWSGLIKEILANKLGLESSVLKKIFGRGLIF